MTAPSIITDHALLRYLQRAENMKVDSLGKAALAGVDVAALRSALEKLCRPAVTMGATAYSALGMTFMMRDGKVMTCAVAGSGQSFRLNAARANGYEPRLRNGATRAEVKRLTRRSILSRQHGRPRI